MKITKPVRLPDDRLGFLIDIKPLLDEFNQFYLFKFPRWNDQFYRRYLHAVGYVGVRVWQNAVRQARLDDVTKRKLIRARYAVNFEEEQVLIIPEDPAAKFFYFGTRPYPGKAVYIPSLRKEKKWITLKDRRTGKPIGQHPGIDPRKVGLRDFFRREIKKAITRLTNKYYRKHINEVNRRKKKFFQLQTTIVPQMSVTTFVTPKRKPGEKFQRYKMKKWRPRKVYGMTPEDMLEAMQPLAEIEDWDLWNDAVAIWERQRRRRRR